MGQPQWQIDELRKRSGTETPRINSVETVDHDTESTIQTTSTACDPSAYDQLITDLTPESPDPPTARSEAAPSETPVPSTAADLPQTSSQAAADVTPVLTAVPFQQQCHQAAPDLTIVSTSGSDHSLASVQAAPDASPIPTTAPAAFDSPLQAPRWRQTPSAAKALSTPNIVQQAMTLLNETQALPFTATPTAADGPRALPDLTEFEGYLNLDSPEQRLPTSNRQLFDGDTPFTDIIQSPNIQDRKVHVAWDKKLDAVNRKLAGIARQQQENTRLLNLILVRLNSEPAAPQESNQPLLQSTQCNSMPPVTISSSVYTQPIPPVPMAATREIAPAVESSTADDAFCDIPSQFRIPFEELNQLKVHSYSTGHFAGKLVKRLFPELFGPDHQRLRFSYNGIKYGKQELDRTRKGYLQRYILFFFPNLNEYKPYKMNVIDPINEVLRRPVKKRDL